jgi:hypothetical protein
MKLHLKQSSLGLSWLGFWRGSVLFQVEVVALCVGVVLCCAGVSAGQTNSSEPRSPVVHPSSETGNKATARKHRKISTSKQISTLPSTSSANPVPARVIFSKGALEVEANNSDLRQILGKIADVSGMTVDGPVKSVRVYGIYGPSNPRDVLTNLLTGLNYNFMMVGVNPEGFPRKLELTLRTTGGVPAAAAAPAPGASDQQGNTDANASGEEQPGPGAIVDVPPPEPEDLEERTKQNLQRLQQMHDEQQKPQLPPQ